MDQRRVEKIKETKDTERCEGKNPSTAKNNVHKII